MRAISCMDNDGQFLLIEAAMVIPTWLKPDNASHRVWIRAGRAWPGPPRCDPSPTLPTEHKNPTARTSPRNKFH